jgi:hypothetical protein
MYVVITRNEDQERFEKDLQTKLVAVGKGYKLKREEDNDLHSN